MMNKQDDQRNIVIAVVLSLVFVLGWQYFYAGPKMRAAQNERLLTQQAEKIAGPSGAAALESQDPTLVHPVPIEGGSHLDRNKALALSPRITIDTDKLTGSIALKGALIDDLSLKNYHETVDANSPIVTLLYPRGSSEAFYAQLGYAEDSGKIALPNLETLWTTNDSKLAVGQPVTLHYDNGAGLIFTRTISLDDQYMFMVKDEIENTTSNTLTLNAVSNITRYGHPKLSGYSALHEGLIGVVGDNKLKEIGYDELYKAKEHTISSDGTGGWIGITDKYWAAALVPEQNATYTATFAASGADEQPTKLYAARVLENAQTLAPAQKLRVQIQVFAGAKISNILDQYQDKFNIKNFDLLISWGYFHFITKPMFGLIDWLYKFLDNFGLAILAVTLIFKAVFFPFAYRSYASMGKMRGLQPKLKALKERFGDDQQKLNQETMALYKAEKINPVAGCLPMLIQLPIFFSLYKVLSITIEMRHAPFYGWIRDLSAPDPTNLFTLFGLIPVDPSGLPLIGGFLHMGIWPMLMGLSLFVQMKLNPEPTDPVQKQMFTFMPIAFTFMMCQAPSGLVIYSLWSNMLTILQQTLIMRHQGTKIELFDNLARTFGMKPKSLRP